MNTLAIIKEQYSGLKTYKRLKTPKNLQIFRNSAFLFLGTTCLFFQGTNVVQSQTVDNSPTSDNLLEQIDSYNSENKNEDSSLAQIINVSQLKDVSPTDWAYEALRSLVDRYGCISGFPNQTYRGNQPLSRYEFAAGLNSCLNQIERLIASSETVMREDIEILQRLTQEFEAELATLGARIDNLEGRTAFLEDNQFSTTSKLAGEAVFNVGHLFIGEDVNNKDLETEPVLGYRARLSFNTSFTGEDLLLTVLNAGNFPSFSSVTGYPEGELGLFADTGNQVGVLAAIYMFPVGDRTTVVLEGFGGIAYDFVDTISPFDRFDDAASGALSQFGLRNPIYNQVSGSGIGIRSELNDIFEVSAGYLAPIGTAENPNPENGLFNGAYAALGQLTIKPGDNLKLGLTYVNAYKSSYTFTGSNLSNPSLLVDAPISSNSYGVQASWSLNNRVIISGWGGYINNRVHSNSVGVNQGDQEIWTWAATLAFPDLLKEGSLGGIIVGMEPRVTESSVNIPGQPDQTNGGTSYHIEAFYQYQLTDNIAITPGAIWITSPDHNEDLADTVTGTLRTTLTF
ncbi:MAG: iron uptake porin [Pleurocapsa sp.]